jgi:hypothetical protein
MILTGGGGKALGEKPVPVHIKIQFVPRGERIHSITKTSWLKLFREMITLKLRGS